MSATPWGRRPRGRGATHLRRPLKFRPETSPEASRISDSHLPHETSRMWNLTPGYAEMSMLPVATEGMNTSRTFAYSARYP